MSARDDNPPARCGCRRAARACSTMPAVEWSRPSASWALGLLRGAEPYRAPAGRKQRVQLRLGHTPRRRAPLVLRLAVVAFVLFGRRRHRQRGDRALAGLGGARLRARRRRPPAGPRVHAARMRAPRAGRAAGRAAGAARDRRAVAVAGDSDEPAQTCAPPVARSARDGRRRRRRARRVRSPRRAPPAGEDASAVSAAMRALRVERNPVRARGLLARYLGEHPNGSLAEEALAMSIRGGDRSPRRRRRRAGRSRTCASTRRVRSRRSRAGACCATVRASNRIAIVKNRWNA